MFHMYDNFFISVTLHDFYPPPPPVTNCHTFSDPPPLERDVLYGRPHGCNTDIKAGFILTSSDAQNLRWWLEMCSYVL